MSNRSWLRRFVQTCRSAVPIAAIATLFATVPAFADWREEAQKAAIKFGDEKKDELIKERSKEAILALYGKLYKSGADPALSRALAEVALSAPELNKLAEETADAHASGDPDKIREAAEKVAVNLGQQLTRLASKQQTRKQFEAVIGKADKVREISEVLGNAASGTAEGRRAAEQYVGQALIDMTPAAGVVGFYQGAYGAMKYANDKYVDRKVEEFYQAYRKADEEGRKFLIEQVSVGQGGFGYVVRDRMMELKQQKDAAIADASGTVGEQMRERMKPTAEDAVADIVSSFDLRIDKERKDAAIATEREKAQAEAGYMLKELDRVSSERNGKTGTRRLRTISTNLSRSCATTSRRTGCSIRTIPTT